MFEHSSLLSFFFLSFSPLAFSSSHFLFLSFVFTSGIMNPGKKWLGTRPLLWTFIIALSNYTATVQFGPQSDYVLVSRCVSVDVCLYVWKTMSAIDFCWMLFPLPVSSRPSRASNIGPQGNSAPLHADLVLFGSHQFHSFGLHFPHFQPRLFRLFSDSPRRSSSSNSSICQVTFTPEVGILPKSCSFREKPKWQMCVHVCPFYLEQATSTFAFGSIRLYTWGSLRNEAFHFTCVHCSVQCAPCVLAVLRSQGCNFKHSRPLLLPLHVTYWCILSSPFPWPHSHSPHIFPSSSSSSSSSSVILHPQMGISGRLSLNFASKTITWHLAFRSFLVGCCVLFYNLSLSMC